MLKRLQSLASTLNPSALAEHVLEESGYSTALKEENTAEADARLENLKELIGSLKEYEHEAQTAGAIPSLPEYLERVSLVTDVDQMDDTGRVSLMTVHAAKGLEFDLVLVAGMEEDLFPYRKSDGSGDENRIEEERRLGYVALTRARKQLFLLQAISRTIFGSKRTTESSRFLRDLPSGVVSRFSTFSSTSFQTRPLSPRRSPGERFVERDVVDDDYGYDDTPFGRGTRVVHHKFGEGKVQSVRTDASPPTVVVTFKEWGTRKIAANMLRLA
jgi:DNA helicase-2/ATP-dependent DNA helicase PcrA